MKHAFLNKEVEITLLFLFHLAHMQNFCEVNVKLQLVSLV